jgi:dUTP pyrophosphatase
MHTYILGRILSSGFVNNKEFSLQLKFSELKQITTMFEEHGVRFTTKSHQHKHNITIVNFEDEEYHSMFSLEFDLTDKWSFVPDLVHESEFHLIDLKNYKGSNLCHVLRGIFEGCGRYNLGKTINGSFRHTNSFLIKLNELINDKFSLSGVITQDSSAFYLTFTGLNFLDLLYHIYYEDTAGYHNPKFVHLYNIVCNWESRNLSFKYKRTHEDAVAPFKTRASDSGYDLTLISKVKEVNGVEFFDTGVIVEPPLGYYFDLVPRSSLSKSGYMLANSVGIIDRGYRANILVPLVKVCKDAPDIVLPFKAVQLIPRRIAHMRGVEVDSFEETQRGEGGFGSTNKQELNK